MESTMVEQGARAATRQLQQLPGPKGLPLIGNALQLDNKRLHLILEAWARQYGSSYRIGFGPNPTMVTEDPAIIGTVLQERPHLFRRPKQLEPILREVNGLGLFGHEGAAWRRDRKLVMPAFSMKQQRELFPMVSMLTQRLLDHWSKAAAQGRVVDVRADLMRFTVDVTSLLVFGHDLDTLGGNQPELQEHFGRVLHGINERLNSVVPYWRLVKLPKDRALDRSMRYVERVVRDMIAKARAELAADPSRAENPRTLLEAMLLAQDEDNPADRFSDDDVIGNAITLLLAGEDTTANTLSWVVHYLAHEPDVASKLRQEADAVLGDAPVVPSYEGVAKLKYATALTHEALRLRGAAPLLFNEAMAPTEVGGVQIPQGGWVICLTRAAGMLHTSFSEPQVLRPERWLGSESPTAVHNPRAALAFGGGPRTCPGRSLALLECAMVTSMLGRNLDVVPVSGRDEVEEVFDFTMSPRGLKVRFQARR